jgi:exopolysaccharide biosynthesis WecB/TagA/CpsF family protein
MPFTRISFLGLPLDMKGEAADIFAMLEGKSQARLVDIAGPEAWGMARNNPAYLEDLNHMSLVVPDGLGVALACRLLTGTVCRSFSFDMTGFAREFFKTMAEKKTALALIGGRPHDDEDAREKLNGNFPGLDIVLTLHGYGDFAPKIAAVMANPPQAIVVSMDSPRQEEFLVALRAAGYKGFAIGCGRFLQNYASEDLNYQAYPAWIDTYHLALFYKLYKEPRRLWQRYFHGYRDFILLLAKELVHRLTNKSEAIIQQVTQK